MQIQDHKLNDAFQKFSHAHQKSYLISRGLDNRSIVPYSFDRQDNVAYLVLLNVDKMLIVGILSRACLNMTKTKTKTNNTTLISVVPFSLAAREEIMSI